MAELFVNQARHYAEGRPSYPSELFQFIASKTHCQDLAWDVGTGNGQAARSVSFLLGLKIPTIRLYMIYFAFFEPDSTSPNCLEKFFINICMIKNSNLFAASSDLQECDSHRYKPKAAVICDKATQYKVPTNPSHHVYSRT